MRSNKVGNEELSAADDNCGCRMKKALAEKRPELQANLLLQSKAKSPNITKNASKV